jgi:hypothetical protein
LTSTVTASSSRREQILSRVGVLAERASTLPGPDGDVDVVVRELTGKQSREFEEAVAKGADAPLGFLLQMCLVDPDTKEPLFEPADRVALEGLGMAGLKPLVLIAQELSGLSEADLEKAKQSLLNAPRNGSTSS